MRGKYEWSVYIHIFKVDKHLYYTTPCYADTALMAQDTLQRPSEDARPIFPSETLFAD